MFPPCINGIAGTAISLVFLAAAAVTHAMPADPRDIGKNAKKLADEINPRVGDFEALNFGSAGLCWCPYLEKIRIREMRIKESMLKTNECRQFWIFTADTSSSVMNTKSEVSAGDLVVATSNCRDSSEEAPCHSGINRAEMSKVRRLSKTFPGSLSNLKLTLQPYVFFSFPTESTRDQKFLLGKNASVGRSGVSLAQHRLQSY